MKYRIAFRSYVHACYGDVVTSGVYPNDGRAYDYDYAVRLMQLSNQIDLDPVPRIVSTTERWLVPA